MVDTIFDMDDMHVVQQNITYQYQPSPHLHSIRHVIAKRCHGKRKRLSGAEEEEKAGELQNDNRPLLQKKSKPQTKLSKPQDFCRDSGLPSPPVEMASTEFLPGTPPPPSPKLVNANDQAQKRQPRHPASGLTATEILSKLDDLKAEKHRLFQIMKRLVQEEAVREREGVQAPSTSNSVDGESRDEGRQQTQQYQHLPQRSPQSSHLSTPPEEHQKYSTRYTSPTPPAPRPPASTSASASATLHVPTSSSSSSSSSSPSFSYFRSYDRHHAHHRPLSSPSASSSRPYSSSAWSNLPRHPLPQS